MESITKYVLGSAIEILPKYGIRELDGVIITHGHADACFGMDDLRGWTLGGSIQPKINVYLSQDGMEVISRAFPYLVDSSLATGIDQVILEYKYTQHFVLGGGEVADFKYHIFDSRKPFVIEGLEFTPLEGKVFRQTQSTISNH